MTERKAQKAVVDYGGGNEYFIWKNIYTINSQFTRLTSKDITYTWKEPFSWW